MYQKFAGELNTNDNDCFFTIVTAGSRGQDLLIKGRIINVIREGDKIVLLYKSDNDHTFMKFLKDSKTLIEFYTPDEEAIWILL